MTVFRVDCEIDGGLLVGDRQVLSDLSDEDLFSLMVAVDEQGQTDLAFDYPGESWPDVYRRETDRLRQRCAAGELLFLNLGAGRFWCRVEDGAPGKEPVGMPAVITTGGLQLPTGDLVIVEAGLFSARSEKALETPLAELALDAGACGLRLMHLSRRNARGVRGEYGTQEHPAVLLQLEPSGEPGPDSSTENNFMGQNPAWLASWVRPEDLVSAVVKRVESEKAILTISFPSGEGYAQAPLGSRKVSAGDRVLLRLLEKSGGRWEAEIAAP